jgi:GTPase SAR1 family protein
MAGIEDEIMCAAKNGHNIIITGQAGTGKSCIMLKLKKELEQSKVVFLTATTGISSSVLGEGARTVHSCFGFKDGRYSNAQLIDTIIRDDNNYEIKEKLLCAHVILIDEVSMLSLKLIKQIEVLLKNVRDSNLPFGGVQIILSGDFYQLKPVPSPQYNDNGEYILQVLDRFHNFQLKKVHRQTEGEGYIHVFVSV